MFDAYKEIQSQFFHEIYQSVVENQRISHAYFIETKGFSDSENFVLSFAKFLLCSHHFTNFDACENCNLCHLVDEQIDSNLLVIRPEGLWIKKNQVEFVKNQFSRTTLNDTPQIYIIMGADKLNKEAANSILKFLEEPEKGIIAILVAENKYQVLSTILSRCQIHTLTHQEKNNIENDTFANLYSFLCRIEEEKEHTICYLRELWHEKYKNKETVMQAFQDLERIYLDILDFKVKGKTSYSNYLNDVKSIANNHSVEEIIRKIKVIVSTKEAIHYNANLSLLMDKFIIDYVGGVS